MEYKKDKLPGWCLEATASATTLLSTGMKLFPGNNSTAVNGDSFGADATA